MVRTKNHCFHAEFFNGKTIIVEVKGREETSIIATEALVKKEK